jgi:cephalosporin hydroxylase
VRLHGATKIVELGTHFGGSATAMCRGMPEGSGGHLLTIDLEHENIEALMPERRMQRFQGDALDPRVIEAIAKAFHHLPIDILYVDADHLFVPTLSMASIYALLLQPQYILMDDIGLNDSMKDMWRVLSACHPDEALDAAMVEPAIGAHVPTPGQGMGVIRLR